MAKITIKNNEGNLIGTFIADNSESIGHQAQNNDIMIPIACGAGACRICIGIVTKGLEYLDPEAFGSKHIETEKNEVLTCICGLIDGCPNDAEIEIQCENL